MTHELANLRALVAAQTKPMRLLAENLHELRTATRDLGENMEGPEDSYGLFDEGKEDAPCDL